MIRSVRRSTLAVFAILLVALAALMGCSGASASATSLKDAAKADLQDVKESFESDDLTSLLAEASVPDLTQYDISDEDFYKALVQHFTYEIIDATSDGDTGTVTVSVTNVNIDKVIENLTSEMSTWASTSEAQKVYENSGEAGIAKYVFTRLMEMLTADDAPVLTSEETLVYKKVDGDWIVDMDESQLAAVLFAGANLTQLDV